MAVEKLSFPKSQDGEKHSTPVTEVREPSLGDFFQNTTFHGVKYIFISTPFRARRVMWFVAVATAIILFTYQVVERFKVYLDYQTTVNVEVRFESNLDFPAVTICNQNSFRASVAAKMEMYSLINDLYKNNNISALGDLNISSNVLDQEDMDLWVKSIGHQLDDFIDSCTWQGEACDLGADFDVVLTDIGVCFTFNASRDGRRLQATEPGARNGLGLVINVEHYEYMRGPQTDVGVKVLLHEPGEIPLMKDMGFAAAPGTHTLMAIKRRRVTSKPHPYSDCTPEGKPMANCFRQCQTRVITDYCACRDTYMPQLHNESHPLCNLTASFQCVPEAHKVKREQIHACYQCSAPCVRVTYEPRLSYGQLSRFNIDRLVLIDPKKKEHVERQFLAARELSQRVIQDIVEEDKTLMNHIEGIFQKMEDLVTSTQNITGDLSEFAKAYNFPDILMKAGDFPQKDQTFLKERKQEFYQALRKKWQMNRYYDMHDYVHILQGHIENGGSSQHPTLEDNIEECLNLTNAQQQPNTNINIINITKAKEINGCDGLLNKTKAFYNCAINDKQWIRSYILPQLANVTRDLHDDMHWLFDNSSYDYEEFPGYKECSEFLNLTFDKVNKTYFKLYELTLDISSSHDMNEVMTKLKTMEHILLASRQVIENEWEIKRFSEYKTCDNQLTTSWGEVKFANCSVLLENLEQKELWMEIRDRFGLVKQIMFDAKTNFLKLSESFDLLSDVQNSTLIPVLSAIEEYRSEKLTKLDLAKKFESSKFTRALAQVSSLSSTLKTSSREFTTNMDKIKVGLKEAYSKVFAFPYPVLVQSNYSSLIFLKELSETNQKGLIENITAKEDGQERLGVIWDAVDLVVADYNIKTESISLRAIDLTQRLVKQVDALNERLDSFQEDSKINWRFYMENFLRLDIFYRELSYENVQQIPSFETLSLLSQVGGFLGLLLGASLLTVCELIDYIGLKILRRWNAQIAPAPVKT